MSALLSSLYKLWPALIAALMLLVPAQAEPRGVPPSRMDAMTQSRVPCHIDAKTVAKQAQKAAPKVAKKSDCCAAGGSSGCTARCGNQCGKLGSLGLLFDFFESRPGCQPRSLADNFSDSDLPTPDRPPRLI